jgi:sterol desaturase/sphingolipid hydroxylase (fatty acid hydroxylase superfamily)
VILGPALTNCHPITGAFWMTFSLAATCGSHSGYFVFGARNHDAHHEFLTCNYGTDVFMDKLFGTKRKEKGGKAY